MSKIIVKKNTIHTSEKGIVESIKQKQGGCPAENNSKQPLFSGYNHEMTEEEIKSFENKSLSFWIKKDIPYP